MNITIITVGKLKEKYLKQAIDEYSKRLSRYCKLNIIELSDEQTPDNASEKEELIIKDKEGDKILSSIKDGMFVVALDLKGNHLTSEEFAKQSLSVCRHTFTHLCEASLSALNLGNFTSCTPAEKIKKIFLSWWKKNRSRMKTGD